ncbi:MAG: hypothetical protein NW201_05755 [Gemmatimonadales bacterium]|nr:hypothetical protein [Gemmatimonadales bacterium]
MIRSILRNRLMAGAAVVAAAGMVACGQTTETAEAPRPTLPANPVQTPQLRQSAFIFDVNMRSGTVRVTAPTATLRTGLVDGNAAAKESASPNFSILGNDVIEVSVANFQASAVGARAPGRRSVAFDVTITNKLPSVRLITPTFPTPPASQAGALLFPFAVNVTTTSGGISANGNEVIVELPSNGEAVANADWNGNGAPDTPAFPALPGAGGEFHNFFNDASCTATPAAGTLSDCFRYETFGDVEGGAQSITRRVGFDLDPTVGQFRARLIVAADLQAVGPGANGTIQGTVSSPQRGPLSGVSVNVVGVASPTPTGAAGDYSVVAPVGVRQVSLSGLPAGCSPVSPVSATVTNGGTTTVNFTVTCTVLTGTINGTLTRTGGGTQSLAGITYTITPAAAGVSPINGTVTGGPETANFSEIVPIGFGAGQGNGAITLGNLPVDCSAPASTPYTGLTAGGTLPIGITVTCTPPPPPPARYVFAHQWGAPAGGTVDLTLTFDPSNCVFALNATCRVPLNYAGLQGTTSLTGSATGRISGRTSLSTPNFGTPTIGGTTLATNFVTNTVSPGGFTNLQTVGILRYTFGAGASGTVTTSTTIAEIVDFDGNSFVLVPAGPGQNLQINNATVTLP